MLDITFDIVGSFLRPQEIKDARAKYNAGEISLDELRAVEDLAIADLVAKEVEHGLPFVTDGEFRRRWWHLDWLKEFDGFTTQHLDIERVAWLTTSNSATSTARLATIRTAPTRRSRLTTSSVLRLQSTRASRLRSVFPAPT